MGRFRRSWELAKASWAIFRSDPSLAVYPIVSAIAVVILAAIIAAPLLVIDGLPDGDNYSVVQIAGLFLIYFACYTAIFYCGTAMAFVVKARMEGVTGEISGWAMARGRMRSIVGYALIAASVGVALRLLADRFKLGGQIAAAIGGAVWSIATFLVVPVLVTENLGPIDAVKRSGALLRKTWGEQVIGNAGIGFVTGIATLLVVLIGAALIVAAIAIDILVLIVVAVVVTAIAVGIVAAISSALEAIYRMALYRYATGNDTADFPAADLLPDAFAQKR
jgi:ABC-type multidrug transport system fused ATPase/permease subunit